MAKVHTYFINNLNECYYKDGYKPSDYINTLEEGYLISLLQDKGSLDSFKDSKGYVGELSFDGYSGRTDKCVNVAEDHLQQCNVTDICSYICTFVSLLVLIPVGILVVAKVLGTVLVIASVLCMTATAFILLMLMSNPKSDDLWYWLFVVGAGALLGWGFMYILNDTSFGAIWKDVISACGMYC